MKCIESLVREALALLKSKEYLDFYLAVSTVASVISQYYKVSLREVEDVVCRVLENSKSLEALKLKALAILALDDLLLATSKKVEL